MPLPGGTNGGSWRALCSDIGSFRERTGSSRLPRGDYLNLHRLSPFSPDRVRFPESLSQSEHWHSIVVLRTLMIVVKALLSLKLKTKGRDQKLAHAQNHAVIRTLSSMDLRLLLTRALGVTLKPWRPLLPLRRKSKSITIRHFDLRQTLGVHHLVFLDDVVLVQQEGGDCVHLIGGERSLFPQRHAAIDVIPYRRREGRVNPPWCLRRSHKGRDKTKAEAIGRKRPSGRLSCLINVGAWPPDPMAPWHPAQPFRT